MAENSQYSEPSIQVPTLCHLEEIADKWGLRLKGTKDLKDYQKFMKEVCDGFNKIDQLPEPTLPVKYPRTPGYRPKSEENKLNAWYWKTNIHGAKTGKLAGKTLAIKDNIAVAGVPMMNGCAALEGYIPEFDATVVTRVLDAGGCILGKAICEGLCLSGSSFTCNKGPVFNYHNHLHSAGGSSAGSGALVASGEVDLAIGGDQGGSVRLPACWCGIVGLKPTFGLVPYTGAMAIDPSIDHLGPIARTVYDCALFLEVLAGYDNGLDARQPADVKVHEYSKELQTDNLNGMKIGLVREGFSTSSSDPEVDEMVRESIMKLREAGALVEDVSIPMIKYASSIWAALGLEGTQDNLFTFGGGGSGHTGYYPTSMMSFAAKSFRSRINDISHIGKMTILFSEYLKQNYPGKFYGKAQNLRRLLMADYASALENFDVVAMPTIPFTAHKLPLKHDSTFEYVLKADDMSCNVFSANLTGLPALSLNVGFINDLPVGVQFEGSAFQEVTLFKVARVLEKILEDTRLKS